MSKFISKPAAALTPGIAVEGTTVLRSTKGRDRFRGTWRGTYVGIEPSPHDGEPMHVFRNGDINGIRQGSFAFPVALVELAN